MHNSCKSIIGEEPVEKHPRIYRKFSQKYFARVEIDLQIDQALL